MDGCLYFIVVSISYLSLAVYFNLFHEIPHDNIGAIVWFIGAAIVIVIPAYLTILLIKPKKSQSNKTDEKCIPTSLEEYTLSMKAQQVREQIYQEELSKKLKQKQDSEYRYKRKMVRKGYWKVTPKQIREMDWRGFESFVANLLAEHGYKTILTPAQKDEGKDIVAEKDGVKYFIECKHWKEGSSVGREYLQKLVGAAAGCGVTNVIFIATCSFHDNAKVYAKEINASKMFHLELWNMNKLLSIANSIPENKYKEQSLFSKEGDA